MPTNSARGVPGQAATLARFADAVDPERILTDEDRDARAREARRIYMRTLAKKAGRVHARNAAERAAVRAAEPQPEPATVLDAVLALDEVL